MFSSSFFNRQSILVFYFPSIIFFTLFTSTVVFATLSFVISHCMKSLTYGRRTFIFIFYFAFECRPALSRVVPPNCTFVLLLEVRVGEAGGGGGAGCNRLVTSIGELTLGPFPCQLSSGGGRF